MIIGGRTGREETAVGVDDATKGCLPRGVLSSRALPGGPENPRPLRSVGPRTFPESMLSQLTRMWLRLDPLLAVCTPCRCEGCAARTATRIESAERGSPGSCGRHPSRCASVSVIGLFLAAPN
eukprot:scaffold22858_cov134-Isochrysis_galbana.AAC.1